MAVQYTKFFKLLIDKQMTSAELARQAGFRANIMTCMKRDLDISLDSIEKICGVLHCGIDDILEFVPDCTDQREDS